MPASRHPPPPQPHHHQPVYDAYDDPNDDDFLPLSNSDVEILYTIVTTAQRLHYSDAHLPPYRALFTAYDRVLAERRIDPNQDRVYFRFLLRMRGIAGAGTDDGTSTLYGKFETLLADMGIQLEVDEGGAGGVVEDITRRFDEIAAEEDEDDGDDGAATPGLPPLSRRASFDDTTMHHRSRPWDDDDGKIAPRGRYPLGKGASRKRTSSRASDTAAFGQRRPSSRASDSAAFARRRTGSRETSARPSRHFGFPHRGRVNSRNAAGHSRQGSRQSNGRARSLSSQDSLRITRTEEIQRPSREPGFYDVDDFSTVPSRRSSISGPAPEEQHYVPPEMLYRPSPTQMLADADTFLYARTLFTARRSLQTWRDKAIAMKERQAQLEEAADLFNKRKRGEAALEALSVTLQARNAAKETEKFYENLYDRVARTRRKYRTFDLFTQWYLATAEAIEKTKLARRQNFLRTVWNAWYEQTAVNELKVRRFTVKRWFNMWRRRTRDRREDERLAHATYLDNRLHKNLVACFWEFCERRAARLFDEKVKAKVFANMIDALAEIVEKQEFVQERRERELKSKCFHRLANKMLNTQTLEPTADDFRRRTLQARVFGQIKLQAKLQPLERQLSQQIVQSRTRQILSVWHVHTQQVIMATQMDRRRILHNNFTAWNDSMRCNVMRDRIDHRVVFDALRKWLLEARCTLYIRVRKDRTKKNLFKRWTSKVEDQQFSLARAERTFTAWQDARLKRKGFNFLQGALDEQRQREAQALAIYEPRAINRTWPKLLARHEHVQQLKQWGSDAEFYTVATHALKMWKESTQQSQRTRRREAYTTIRRRVKLSMARRMFEKLRTKSSTIEFMDRQAQELQENAVLKIATRQLDHWHDRTASVFERNQMSENFRRRELMGRYLGALSDELQIISRDDEKAAAFLEVHVAAEASVCFKRLNWRLFQVQRQEQSGFALAERNFEKHVKNMFRHWADQMHQSRRDRGIEQAPDIGEGEGQIIPIRQPFEEDSNATEERDADNEETVARNDQWNPFDSSALDVDNLKLNLNFDSAVLNRPILQPRPPVRSLSPEKPNPFAMTIRNPEAALGPPITSTPVPGYLRSPSKRSTIRAAKAREKLAALSLTAAPTPAQNDNRPAHPLSKTVTATSGTAPSANASFDSATAPRSGSAAAPSYTASTFVLNTHTGTTTPQVAPSAFSSFDSPGISRAVDQTVMQAPGTAPAAMTGGGTTAFMVPSDTGAGRARNFGASTMLAGTPGPAANKTAITPFARKLTAQGYSAGASARGSESARSRRSRGYGSVGLGLAGFGGFEDIAEDESPRDGGARRTGNAGEEEGRRERSRESSP